MIGTRLSDRYEITGELGRGGMGVVYRAHDPVLDREVAIKIISPTHLSDDAEERFRREAQLVGKMDHPAIVPIYDFGRHEDSLYLIMPVVPGTSLRPFLRDQSLLLGDVLDIGVQVAEALEYSHASGVVHRDIKPENIMVAREDAGGVRVRVMDFGLARVSTKTRLTQTGVLVGTMAYLSPEQVLSQPVDGRSDLYSLGTVLYECLVGRPPFQGEMQSILYRIVHELPQSPRTLGVEINEGIEEAILGCLAKDAAERPQTAAKLVESLARCREQLRDSDRKKSVLLSGSGHVHPPVLAPFVGRKSEVKELQQRLNAAIAGECQFVVVGGDPGSGKTRLLDELEGLSRARGLRVLHGRFMEQNRSFPYQGFCEAIQEFFRQKESGSSSTGLPDLSDLAPDLVALFPMLAEIGEISSATDLQDRIAQSPENKTQVFELLARTFIRIAGGKPLVLLLEDLHGAEVSIEALQYVVPRLGPTPTLVVGTYRTNEIDRHHPLARLVDAFEGDRRFASLTLGPFTPSEHRKFLETLVGGAELADDLVQKVFERTEGDPFFTKELVRALLDSGAIGKDDTGQWSLAGEVGVRTEELPATIQQAVEKRIQRLPAELRDVLAIASVIGKTFDFRDLESLASDKADVDEAVDRLIEEGLVEEQREARADLLTFNSGVVRDVLYAQLSRRKRRSLHRKCGEQLEARQKGRLERILPQLLFHFSEGDVPEKTVEYGLKLAQRSLETFSPEEAIRATKTALEFLDEEWEGDRALEGEARLLLARAFRMAGDVDGSLVEAKEAIEVHSRCDLDEFVVEGILFAAKTAWQARRIEQTERWVEEGIARARGSGRSELYGELLSLAATVANLRGEYDRANRLLEEAQRLGTPGEVTTEEKEAPTGGRLIVPFRNPVGATEPVEMDLDDEAELLANVFETLLATDAEGNLVPSLCDRWQVRNDGRSFLLHLRPDVRFQDGHPMAAADVKASFERSIRRAPDHLPPAYTAIQGFGEFIEESTQDLAGLLVHGDHELEIRLQEPLPIYPAFLTDFTTGIVRELADTPTSGLRVVGTGPFSMASRDEVRVVLERSAEYWRGTPAKLDTVEFRPGTSASRIAEGLRTGEFGLARDLVPDDLEGILRDPRFRNRLVETPKTNTNFVLFNCRSGPAARDESTRRALCGLVRPSDLVWKTLGRFGQPAACLIPPGILGHDPGRKRTPMRLEEAEELIDSAGVDRPVVLRAAVHPLLQDRCRTLIESLFSLWGELGAEVRIETSSMASFLEAWEHGEGLDLVLSRWNADYDDPDNFTHTLFHSERGQLRTYFCSPESDEILEEARTEGRPAAREAFYRRFEGLLHDNAVLLPLFHDIDYRIAGPRVRGLRLRSAPPYADYAEIGVSGEESSVQVLPAVAAASLHIPLSGTLGDLDPSLSYSDEQAEVIPCIYETLTREVGQAQIVPWLASEFQVDNQGRTYRFRLRKDVRFHDGRPLTARDVRYSFERLLQNSLSESRWLLPPILGARAVLSGETTDLRGFRIDSTHSFTIELKEPVSFFPVLLSYPATAIVPEGSDPAGSDWERCCIGTGPFCVQAFDPGRHLELAANRGYWREGYPRSSDLTFHFGVTPPEMLSGFREGRFSLISDLYPSDVEKLRRDTGYAAGYQETPRLCTYYLAFNRYAGPLSDRTLRHSLIRTVGASALVHQTLGRLAIPAQGFIPPGLLGHEPGRASPSGAVPSMSAPDIEVKAAVSPVFLGGYAEFSRELTRAMVHSGVRIRRVNETMAEYVEAASQGSVDAVVGRWVADFPDADAFVHGSLHTKEGFLGKLCGSPEIDDLIAQGRLESNPAVRHRIYRRIEELLVRDAVLLPLFHEQVYRFARPEVQGVTIYYGAPVVRYEDLRIRG